MHIYYLKRLNSEAKIYGADPLARNIVLTYKIYKYVTKLLHNIIPQTLNVFLKQN